MAKIKEMTTHELQSNMEYMARVPVEDPCFSGWNFDSQEWRDKYIELIDEAKNRSNKDD